MREFIKVFLKLSLFMTFLWGIFKILDPKYGLSQKSYWKVEGLYRNSQIIE